MLLTVLIFQEKLEIQVFMKNLFKMLASNLYNGASLIAQRVKNLPTNAGDTGDMGSIPGLGRSPWSRKWQPTSVFLLGKFHGQRSLVGYCPGNHKKLHMIEHTYNLKYIDIYRHTFIHFQNRACGTHLLSASEGIFLLNCCSRYFCL